MMLMRVLARVAPMTLVLLPSALLLGLLPGALLLRLIPNALVWLFRLSPRLVLILSRLVLPIWFRALPICLSACRVWLPAMLLMNRCSPAILVKTILIPGRLILIRVPSLVLIWLSP